MPTPRPNSLVVLLTDFGSIDTYVGVMKGVISGLAPDATVVDLNHAVPPGDIRQAAFKLWQSVHYFPADSIFVIVVDPGVGTERRPVVVHWQDRDFVAPDNGVLTYLLAQSSPDAAFELSEPRYQRQPVSTTFHGRDIFAPAGGHLAAGVPIGSFGPAVDNLEQFELPTLKRKSQSSLSGQIVHVDRFGNLITSIGRLHRHQTGLGFSPWLPFAEPDNLAAKAVAHLPDGTELPLSSTFGDVPHGEPVAYLGSEAMLEIAINGGSAAEHFSLTVDDPITLTFRG
ncbi:MAG: SAM-dependent chlorinase/fluorinase [Anaerolineales bacterium]